MGETTMRVQFSTVLDVLVTHGVLVLLVCRLALSNSFVFFTTWMWCVFTLFYVVGLVASVWPPLYEPTVLWRVLVLFVYPLTSATSWNVFILFSFFSAFNEEILFEFVSESVPLRLVLLAERVSHQLPPVMLLVYAFRHRVSMARVFEEFWSSKTLFSRCLYAVGWCCLAPLVPLLLYVVTHDTRKIYYIESEAAWVWCLCIGVLVPAMVNLPFLYYQKRFAERRAYGYESESPLFSRSATALPSRGFQSVTFVRGNPRV